MSKITQNKKIEFGDFQTPIELASIVTQKLVSLEVKPDIVIEPTCGIGNFLLTSSNTFKSATKLIGIDINPVYLEQAKNNKFLNNDPRITIRQENFFNFKWLPLTNSFKGKILVLGNFPWVTNSKQGLIEGNNLPQKSNFQNHQGLNAITGNSNFDVSEWMLIKTIDWLQNHDAYLAMLCKTSVARKILNYIRSRQLNLSYCATYGIDAKKYFKANVQSCLLFCKFAKPNKQYYCDVFSKINSINYQRIGYYNKILVKDIEAFNRVSFLFANKTLTPYL